jgi:hypothetical protein
MNVKIGDVIEYLFVANGPGHFIPYGSYHTVKDLYRDSNGVLFLALIEYMGNIYFLAPKYFKVVGTSVNMTDLAKMGIVANPPCSGKIADAIKPPKDCECGKDKHGFAMHTHWCPKFAG